MPPKLRRILVTGGAGFIGSAFIRFGLKEIDGLEKIVNLDLLTYAGNLRNLQNIEKDARYRFIRGNILNGALIEEICRKHDIETIVHFAAESHVDRSIKNPKSFYETNVLGTINLLELVRRLPEIHFHHVSTDEVYGSIARGQVSEGAPYSPNSPYAASKAASDHFVRAYTKTYRLSTTVSHCTNNYGPYQYPEKFIPRMIYGCLMRRELPIYGKGMNCRDWLYVEDHVEAIWMILQHLEPGKIYNIGAGCEKKNLDLLHLLIEKIAEVQNERPEIYRPLIRFVEDRPGHDERYALDCAKIQKELGWRPRTSFDQGLEKTIHWYLENREFYDGI